jgi:hypothetical protein
MPRVAIVACRPLFLSVDLVHRWLYCRHRCAKDAAAKSPAGLICEGKPIYRGRLAVIMLDPVSNQMTLTCFLLGIVVILGACRLPCGSHRDFARFKLDCVWRRRVVNATSAWQCRNWAGDRICVNQERAFADQVSHAAPAGAVNADA